MTETEALGISEATYGGGFDPADVGSITVNDPFSYFDPVTESYFPGAAPGRGGANRDYGTDFSTSPGMLIRESTTLPAIQEIINEQYYKELSDRISANRVGGRESYAYGMEDFPTGQTPSFGMLEEAGLLGGARPSYAAPATQPTATASERGLATEYTPGDYGQSIFQTLDRGIPGVTTNTSGKSELQALVDAGLGNVTGLNPNNPDQTAQQLLNSFRANDYLTEYGPSLFTAGLPPGMGLAFNAIRSGANVLSGRTTPGQALMGVGLDALASKLGIPGGGPALSDLLEGRVGSAAGRAASGLATSALGRAGLGALAPIVAKETGLGPAIQKSVSDAVQPQPGQGTRFVSSITDAINRGPKGIMGFFGGTPSAPIPATPGVTTPTRAYTTPDFNPYESGGNEPPAAATAPTTPAATTPEAATRRLLYGTAQGPYGPLLAYDFGEA
jgi:hypothetical protein